MKKIFESFFNQPKEQPQQFVDVMEVVPKAYPKIVQEIHTEFMTAGDKLLASAKDIISRSIVENESKVNALKDYGFISTAEVWRANEILDIKRKQEAMAKAIDELSREFPLYKVITENAVKIICKKYGLVLGENSQYTGFVPEKNLKEIEKFFINHPEERTQHYKRYRGWNSEDEIITKADYDSHLETKKARERYNISESYYYGTRNTHLSICAPLKDMHTTGYRLEGYKLVKDIPDPIVMLPKKVNGIEMYVIITAWGDEQNDPLVFNEKNN